MEELWQQLLAWGQVSNLNTLLLILLGILVVSAVVSFVFRLVRVGIIVLVVLLLVGVSPLAITSWVSNRMDANNFGLAKLENADRGPLPLATTWKATTPAGKVYICNPDITPEGIGGLVCDDLFYPASSVKTAVQEEKALSLTFTDGKVLRDCAEVKEGYSCPTSPEVKFKYTAPAE